MSAGQVAVIGAGIGGMVTALALHRIGAEVSVYEAYEHGADHVGAFLTTATNGLAALQVVGAHEGVLAAGFPTPHFEVCNSNGRRLGVTTNPTGLAGRPETVTIRRSDLYRSLADDVQRAGIPTEYGKRLSEIDEVDGGVRARFTDGSSAAADLLIGADGLRSRVRTIVDPHAPAPRYLGLVGCGGYTRSTVLDSTPGVFHFVFGKRAFFGYTVDKGGQVLWFANLPRQDEPTRAELAELGGDALREALLEAFAHDRFPAAAVVRGTDELTALLPMHDLAPLPAWRRGRIALVGDAAHVTSPSSGQGASLAMEDAVVLAQCLRDLPDHRQAFARYQQLRWDRVKRIYDQAVKINNNKAAGPVARRIRDAAMTLVFKLTDPSKAQAAVHNFTIDWDQHVAPVAA